MQFTQDGVLICSHEPWIEAVSNVALPSGVGSEHEDFTSRRKSRLMDDDDPEWNWNDHGNITDFFTYDFTLEELQVIVDAIKGFGWQGWSWDIPPIPPIPQVT